MLSRFAAGSMVRVNMVKSVAAVPVRDFAKKFKKAKTNVEDKTDYESFEESASHSDSAFSQNGNEPWKRFDATVKLDKALYQPFSLGEVKVVKSTPGNKAPTIEDTIAGRYASVLFTTASSKEALFDVYEDMMYLSELYTHSEVFRQFTENAGVGHKEIVKLNKALQETAPFHEITLHFLLTIAENKRLIFVKDIANLYKKLYQQYNKQEKITIISAEELSESQKGDVLKALQGNPQNAGKAFTIEYQIDGSIIGGLQMYTESEFMDMSLASRLSRINEEVVKLTL